MEEAEGGFWKNVELGSWVTEQTWAGILRFPLWNMHSFVWLKWKDGLQIPFGMFFFLYPVSLALARAH